MFKIAGFVTDVCWTEAPTTSWRLYRGHDVGHMRGMAWTTSRAKARWFADRFYEVRPATFVFEATIPPHAVLATIAGRNENEVVVNPYCLRGRATPAIIENRGRG